MGVATIIVDWLVFVGGLGTWLLFVPQIRVLTRVKDSRSFSFQTLYGSLALQVTILAQAALHLNGQLIFTMVMSVAGLCLTIGLTHYYRHHPGGKQKQAAD